MDVPFSWLATPVLLYMVLPALIIVVAVYVIVVLPVARRQWDDASAEPRCPGCRYLLIGLTGTRCPECGRSLVDDDSLLSRESAEPQSLGRLAAAYLIPLLLVGAAICAYPHRPLALERRLLAWAQAACGPAGWLMGQDVVRVGSATALSVAGAMWVTWACLLASVSCLRRQRWRYHLLAGLVWCLSGLPAAGLKLAF